MANSSEEGKQASIQSVCCSPTLLHGTMYEAYVDHSLAGLNFLLAITAFLGNLLILCALKKETSFHPPTHETFIPNSRIHRPLRGFSRASNVCVIPRTESQREMETLSPNRSRGEFFRGFSLWGVFRYPNSY